MKEKKTTRPISVFEFELGSHKPKEGTLEEGLSTKTSQSQPPQEDILEDAFLEEEISPEEMAEPDVLEEEEAMESAAPQKYKTYTIQKDDTLQKISKKFYGTTTKWLKLYEVNKDVLKDPDKVYPGVVIKIPSTL